jgi:hypothetical protein
MHNSKVESNLYHYITYLFPKCRLCSSYIPLMSYCHSDQAAQVFVCQAWHAIALVEYWNWWPKESCTCHNWRRWCSYDILLYRKYIPPCYMAWHPCSAMMNFLWTVHITSSMLAMEFPLSFSKALHICIFSYEYPVMLRLHCKGTYYQNLWTAAVICFSKSYLSVSIHIVLLI